MPELADPMPKLRKKPQHKKPAAPAIAPPPEPPRYVAGVWRPNAPGFPDTPHIPGHTAAHEQDTQR